MKKIALLSSKNQVTIPQSFIQALGIGHRSTLSLAIEEGAIVLRPHTNSIVSETAGSLKNFISPSKRGVDVKDALAAIKKPVAEHLVNSL